MDELIHCGQYVTYIGTMNGHPVVEVRPLLIERLILWSLYYWAVVVAGLVLALPVALIFGGQSGPVGRVLVVAGWVLLAVPFVLWVHRFNARFLDRATLRLAGTTLSLGRHGQTEISLDDVRHAYFVARRTIRRPRYVSADRSGFDLMLLVLADESLLPLAPAPTPVTGALIAALDPKLRDHEPLPSYAQRHLRRSRLNRRHTPGRDGGKYRS